MPIEGELVLAWTMAYFAFPWSRDRWRRRLRAAVKASASDDEGGIGLPGAGNVEPAVNAAGAAALLHSMKDAVADLSGILPHAGPIGGNEVWSNAQSRRDDSAWTFGKGAFSCPCTAHRSASSITFGSM